MSAEPMIDDELRGFLTRCERTSRVPDTVLIFSRAEMMRALATIQSQAARIAALGQLLAHVHLHLTNDEDFDADEFERDLRNLDAGKWIDTETLLIEAREKLAEAEEAHRGRLENLASATAMQLNAMSARIAALTEALAEAVKQRDFYESALYDVAEVGDGYGSRNRRSGTLGEGHADCQKIADNTLGVTWEDLPADANDADHLALRERHKARIAGAHPASERNP